MRRFSEEWIRALSQCRFAGPWPDWSGPRNAPVMPWITLPIHPLLRQAFEEFGEVQEFKAGDWLFPRVQVRSYMLVEAALTGRIVATADGQPGAGAMALSAPMRNAAGNLNWMTHRAAIGRYQALSDARVRVIPHAEALHYLLEADRDFQMALYAQQELINLSDRFGFAVLALLPALERFKVLLIGWSLFYGELIEAGGRTLVRIPSPGRKNHIAQVIRTSLVTLDTLLTEMRRTAGYERDGDFLIFDAASLQDVHAWMRQAEGTDAYLARPERVEDMLAAAQAEPVAAA